LAAHLVRGSLVARLKPLKVIWKKKTFKKSDSQSFGV
jgi:hypothetical protein